MVGKSSVQEIATLAKFFSALWASVWSRNKGGRGPSPGSATALIWRPGDMIRNLESPGLSGRVDSTELTQSPKA